MKGPYTTLQAEMCSPFSPEVVIIGAGPYGLSIAAHLRSHGVNFRIFGMPMQTWLEHMPKGMLLKSEGCASNLFDPINSYTLEEYCAEKALPYAHYGAPVSLETFACYGLSFQRRLVPTVENVKVKALDRTSSGFDLELESGEKIKAGKVIIATGMSHTQYIPAVLAHLPKELLSHSGNPQDWSGFTGRDVTVIGRGQSALEAAALLHEAKADTHLVVRGPRIFWNPVPNLRRRLLRERMRRPMSNLGPGLGPWFYANAPMLFCRLPQRIRIARVKKALGPAGAWWLKQRVVDHVPVMLGHVVRSAEPCGEKVLLHLQGSDGELRQLLTDHVIAATGYRFAVASLPFLSKPLLSHLRSVRQIPVLSSNFESSVPGLYFTGLASANQFGPAMRFLHGAGYTARRVSRHIAGGRGFDLPGFGGSSRDPKCHEF